jgi:hypothetical protein
MFDSIVGYDGIKCTFVRSLTSKQPVHIVLVGPPPGQAKLMIKISVLLRASDRCLDIINLLKFIIRSNAGFGDVLSVLLLGIQILIGGF